MNASPISGSAAINSLLADVIDEMTQRLNEGRPVTLQEYVDNHPELAAVLPRAWQALTLLREPQPTEGDDESNAFEIAGRLGDFRLLREIGRGGMGVVYEAEQISLGRRMALKVLPFAAMLDKQQLNRFRNEARAAATLDHPNIVAVHSVGEQRAVHYYAMQLVEGQSLAEVITARRQRLDVGGQKSVDSSCDEDATIEHISGSSPPAPQSSLETKPIAALSTVPNSDTQQYFRTVAQLGIQAAKALDHAHQNGIVHRDVKPGNLLLDSEGKLYVTDFGLARIEADAGMTMTGDLLGTLAYMSPEQALAKRVVIDHRTDIYSLGVTLYELLTLQKPYEGTDRQELLSQIAFDEPRGLLQINPRISKDLATIVGKAMEKSPEDRYATAANLAEDLQAFLEHRAITARPPSTWQQIAKWSRRHVEIVYMAMAASLTIAIVSSAATALISQSRSEAIQQRGVAEEAARIAETQKQLADRQRDITLQNNYVASIRLAQKDWSEGNQSRVAETLDQIVPQADLPDLRGWEWYYLKSRLLDNSNALNPDLGPLQQVAWNSEGTLLAAAGDKGVKIFDSASREVVHYLSGWRDFDWQPQGSYLAGITRGEPHRIVVWDPATGKEIASTKVDNSGTSLRESRSDHSEITRLQWNPAGSQIAWSQGYSLKLWNFARDSTLEYENTIRNNGTGFTWLEWQPDGEALRLIDGHFGPCLTFTLDSEEFSDGKLSGRLRIAYSNRVQAPKLASTGNRGEVFVSGFGKLTTVLKSHRGTVQSLAWSPNDQYLVSGGLEGVVQVWMPERGLKINKMIGHAGPVTGVDWSSDDLVVSCSTDGWLRFWSPFDNAEAKTIPGHSAVVWNPVENLVAIPIDSQKQDVPSYEYRIFSTQTTELVSHISGRRRVPKALSWSPNGRFITECNSSVEPLAGSTGIWNANTGESAQLFEPPDKSHTHVIAWSPDSRQCANLEPQWSISIWDITTGDCIHRITHPVGVYAVSWSPDGRWLAAVYGNIDVGIWDAAKWELLWTMSPPDLNGTHVGAEPTLAWHPESSRLATHVGPGRIAVWELHDQQPPALDWVSSVFTIPIRCMAWSPDGSRIATFGNEGLAKVWDADDGRELLAIDVGSPGKHIAWSADGLRLMTADFAAGVKIWDATLALEQEKEDVVSTEQ